MFDALTLPLIVMKPPIAPEQNVPFKLAELFNKTEVKFAVFSDIPKAYALKEQLTDGILIPTSVPALPRNKQTRIKGVISVCVKRKCKSRNWRPSEPCVYLNLYFALIL